MVEGSRKRVVGWPGRLPLLVLLALLSACSSLPPPAPPHYITLSDPSQAQEAVMTALGLVDTGYRFGGAHPEAGLDCSGMVSYVYVRATGLALPHNAARMAAMTRPVERAKLRPGDLVFFNTENRPTSHVGLYIGEGRFIHAPSSRGKVQISSLNTGWFASRFETARTLMRE